MTRRWVLRVVVPVVVAGLVSAGAVAAGGEVNFAFLVGTTALVAVLIWLALDLSRSVQYPSWNVTATHTPRQPGTDMRLARFTDRLTSGVDRDAVAADVHRLLADVVDVRLRRKYGVDRAADPEAARAVVGPELAAYLDGKVRLRRTGQAEQISGLLDRIEGL